MPMTETERDVLKRIVKRLRGENASQEVVDALTGPAKVYLETWVIPSLELLAKESRTLNELILARDLVR